MKLSDMMREGAKLHPQGAGAICQMSIRPQVDYETCALGAAYVAAFGVQDAADILHMTTLGACQKLEDVLGYDLYEVRVKHPSAKEAKPMRLADIITNLNDSMGWTREKIADWLESIGY